MLALLACACPKFADMEVTGDAAAGEIDLVRGTLDQFASWTGREGVCVPDIQASEDLPEPLGWPDTIEVGGAYAGAHQPIRIDVDAGETAVDNTRHELCHALDEQTGLSIEHATLIPDTTDPDLYAEEKRDGEDFARLCQEWPVDTTFEAAIVDACGGEPVDAVAQFILDEVYPDSPRLDLETDPVSLQVDELTWEPADVGGSLHDIRELDGAMAALVVSGPDASARRAVSLRTFTADLASVKRDAVLMTGGNGIRGTFVASDEGIYVRFTGTDEGTVLVRVDPTTWAVETLPVDNVDSLYPLVVSGERIYADDVERGSITARTVEGEEVDLDIPTLLFDQVFWPDVLWPLDGGFGFYAYEGSGTWIDGKWSLTPGPLYTHDRQALDDGRVLVHAVWGGARMMIEDHGAWRIAGDPCDPRDKDAWAYGGLAVVGGRIFRSQWQGVPTDDLDGDGRIEETLYSLVVGR